MACASLQGFAILHQCLNTESLIGTSKAFACRLYPFVHGHGHILFCKCGIYLQHLLGLVHGFGLGGVGGVALLPKELGSAQEKASAHLPAHHIGPLVA